MADLDIDNILSTNDFIIEQVKIPEWKGDVYVRSMTAAERLDLFSKVDQTKAALVDLHKLRIWICVYTMCDAKGKRMLDNTDFDKIAKKNTKALDRIANAAQKLNAFAMNSIEDEEKN